MAFSLESPGFSIDVSDEVDVHQSDTGILQLLGNSSTSGDSTRPSCLHCHGRMSSLSLDCHTFCSKCRGADCDLDSKCDECMSWTREEMEAYVKLRKSLAGKSKHCKSSSKPPSSPRSTSPVESIDTDSKIASQISSFSKSIDEKLVSMSEGLFSKFSDLLGQFKLELANASFAAEPEVLGRTPESGQPVSLRHPVRTAVHPQRFQGTADGPMPSGSGYAHLSHVSTGLDRSSVCVGFVQSQNCRGDDPEAAQPTQPAGGPRVTFAASGSESVFVREPEDEEEDDRDSIGEAPVVDKTFNRLVNYVYDQYDSSRPFSDPAAPPRCDFEAYFAVSEPQSSLRLKLRLYPRVDELMSKSKERAAKFVRESKPLHKVIPIRRKVFPVADDPDFSAPRWLNPDFARISNNKLIAKTRYSTATFADLEKVEKASRALIAGQSQSYWLLSALLSQLKRDGFQPSDPSLFDKNMSALFASFAMQTSICSGLTDFVEAKHRESSLAHVSFPVLEPQKCELLVATGLNFSF